MARPWQRVDRVETPAGSLELRRRGERDFLIVLDGRVLMQSFAHRSESALASLACASLASLPHPNVLIGGLGMGFTLRAALDTLPAGARVCVAELEPAVVRWCRGPLAPLCGSALEDPRVRVALADVASLVAAAARPGAPRLDAIMLDLHEGPPARGRDDDPLFGDPALTSARAALAPGGVLGLWCEQPRPAFEKRLRRAGFRVERHRPGRGGLRHAVVLGRPD